MKKIGKVKLNNKTACYEQKLTNEQMKAIFEQKRAIFLRKYNAGKCSVCGHNMRDKSKPCKECERVRKSRRFIRGHNFGKNQRSGGASR
tara:strand:+ start:52 stop:318 length:267 start_codon:yes stop_codon:yes gene_type:complete